MLHECDFHDGPYYTHVGNKAHFIFFLKIIHCTYMERDLDLLFHPM